MIFKFELDPRDHKGFHEMLHWLQSRCVEQTGQYFDLKVFEMGQLHPNSELYWVKATLIYEAHKAEQLKNATEFLNANGYKVEPMPAEQRFPPKLKTFTGPVTKTPEGGWPPIDPNTMEGKMFAGKPERIWRDKDMINFATIVFFRGPNEANGLLEDYANRFR